MGEGGRLEQAWERLPSWVRRVLRVEVLLGAAVVLGAALLLWYEFASRVLGGL